MGTPVLPNRSILTPTGGFLASGFTHSINAYQGCSFANALCGTFCYAQHNQWITRGRPWGLYGVKESVADLYVREYDRLKRPRRGAPRPLRIFMSSSTDPYLPQEKTLGRTRGLLEAMRERPPDALVIQTHHTMIQRDLDLIRDLSGLCSLRVSVTIETDMASIPGFPPHVCPPEGRLRVLELFRTSGVPTQATVSPLLPLADPEGFARRLDRAGDRIILDHFLIGDGSPGGSRTRRTTFIRRLESAGLGAWAELDRLWEFRDLAEGILGRERVLVSCDGFNTI
ncbi:MAG: hypothetical protein U0790_09940 [Isosphaeraceae bacterium]